MTSDCERFLDAQAQSADGYQQALKELQTTGKRGHWIWYIFPQLAGLGQSPTARHYAIPNLDEARAYLKHPVLGPRLLEISAAALARFRAGTSVLSLLDSEIDAKKLVSCMTLFYALANEERASPFTKEFANVTGEILSVAESQGFSRCTFTQKKLMSPN